jgi:hypothetical protein
MNRQARLEGSNQWNSYADVTFFAAIKEEAKRASRRNSLCEATWVIECRCESEPEKVETFSVQVNLHAEVLNPRQGDL